MDMLVTAIALGLLLLAAWMIYKRYSARFNVAEPTVIEEDYEDDAAPAVQEAVAEPAPEAESKKDD